MPILTVAFIGLGNMGGPVAANLVKAGHAVRGVDLGAAHLEAVAAAGVAPKTSAAEAVAGAEVVITMLQPGPHVLAVWSDVLAHAAPGTLVIDSSTIDLDSARKAHAMAAERGCRSVDAPVSGGTGGATAATLTSCAAARRRRSRGPRRCWPRWAKESSIAAQPETARRQKSATT
ncbi:NAD(P)-binding domain-containing protein [Rhodoplanes sp.]|uniref:NAD(P)-binding domain-containing protein n=1 Tax=Rhodoplanes sp. TaxID=1968906 RepID=UPI0025F3AF34|nr:NAD(P)-binding domain-containing protein [Rhodoplanes sp.]